MENVKAVKTTAPTKERIEEGKTIPLKKKLDVSSFENFLKTWSVDFTERIKLASKTRKVKFTYEDAEVSTTFITDPLDKVLIEYQRFVKRNPLRNNDYYKYVVSYQEGTELNIKYFKHNKKKLREYYKKIDKDAKSVRFDKKKFEVYVLFMMLKLKGLYSEQYDVMFNITKVGHREYNPLTNLPSVLRGVLPFDVIEFDIVQAFPSFIFKELSIEPFDVYAKMSEDRSEAKRVFNTLINTHKDSDKATISNVRAQLRPIYGERVIEVITSERFNNRGKTFDDFTKHESEFINRFVQANHIDNYVRLHDGVVVLKGTEIEETKFDYITFSEGAFAPPITENILIPFHNDFNLTEASRYAEFFKQEGFIRLMIEGKDEISVIKNDNKVIKHFNWKTETISFLKANICSLEKERLQNTLASDEKKIKNGFLLMDSEPLKLHKDEKNAVYISFKNGVARITTEGVEVLPYEDASIKFFAENESQKHSFNYIEDNGFKSNFAKFIERAVIGRDNFTDEPVNEKEREDLTAFCSMLGYLISNYKDPSQAFAIVLSDEGATNNERKGRRGKSLIFEALKKVKPVKWSQGDSFKTDYIHKFADLERIHDIYVLDDTPANFNYNSFYGEITSDVKIERKGSAGEVIPFEYAPKFVFTTNYSFRYNEEDASTIGRFYEYKLKPFFSIENKVNEYFNQTFFAEWSGDEWREFYCFMVYCVQTYLSLGIKRIEYDKSHDNYLAYFNNEVKEQECERVLEALKPLKEFNTSKFLEVYKDGRLYSERLFTDKNVKKHLEVFTKQRTDYNLQRKSETSRLWMFT
jgi:hypothetical protein